MLAGELLFDYVLTAGVGALPSVSNKVRWLLNGYRGTKLLIKGGFKTLGKWVFDGTLKGLKYLDASVVAPAMARLSSGKQAVVDRSSEDTAASTRKAVADGGTQQGLAIFALLLILQAKVPTVRYWPHRREPPLGRPRHHDASGLTNRCLALESGRVSP
jgi:hypothetical protein